jgi:hypothetical protein
MTAALPAIIFVPGIRVKPPAEEQQQQLRRCLEYGLAGSGVANAGELSSQLEVVGWSHHFYGEHADIAPDIPGIERLLAGSGDPDVDYSEAHSIGRRFTAAMYAIGDLFPVLSSLFATRRMETRVQEINRYFLNEQGEGERARELVRQHLHKAWQNNARVMLIGHSFGSVIAYDALWELSQQGYDGGAVGNVDLFVTMGSPLTMRYIRRRLKGAGCRNAERYPGNIRDWLNLAAVGEVTALDRRMNDCFAEMLELGLVDTICDDLDLMNRFRGPDGLNVHKCYGYLASQTVAEVVGAFAAARQ